VAAGVAFQAAQARRNAQIALSMCRIRQATAQEWERFSGLSSPMYGPNHAHLTRGGTEATAVDDVSNRKALSEEISGTQKKVSPLSGFGRFY
jgi:hypothetical protein